MTTIRSIARREMSKALGGSRCYVYLKSGEAIRVAWDDIDRTSIDTPTLPHPCVVAASWSTVSWGGRIKDLKATILHWLRPHKHSSL